MDKTNINVGGGGNNVVVNNSVGARPAAVMARVTRRSGSTAPP